MYFCQPKMKFTELITYLFIGIGLSFDSFAVSISCGLAKREIRFWQATRVAGILAFFQAIFPILGWIVGTTIHDLIARFDHWIAFSLLVFIGIKMIVEARKPDGALHTFNPFRTSVLLGLAVATSIDALVVGLSFGFVEMPILIPVLIIGVVTFIAAMLGMLFGKNIPAQWSHRALIVGGIILIVIGIKILIEQL
jgi:putative Mn2+ efflux pump MntP